MAPTKRHPPGAIRDAIVRFLRTKKDAQVDEILAGVKAEIGTVAASSVRSYLNLNVGVHFTRVDRGRYRLNRERSDG